MNAALPESEADLRRRLSEAEDTLRAIRDGEVDALVVRGGADDEIFALGGDGEDSYRAFMEAMDIGAAALDGDRRLIYANAALCSLLRLSSQQLQQRGLDEALGSLCADAVGRLIDRAEEKRQSGRILLCRVDGDVHVEVTVAPLPLSFSRGYAVTFTDVSERIAAAAAEETERVGRAIMMSSNEAVLVCDLNGVISHANLAVRQFHDKPLVGIDFAEAFPLQLSLSAGLMHVEDLIGVALAGNSVRGVEAVLPGAEPKDVIVSAAPLRQAGDVVGGCVINIIDVSDQKAVEKRQKLLMGELAHRVKNTLTLVLSISNRTISGAHDLTDFRTTFGRRIEALAATHNLLAEDAWSGLTLADLIGAELAPYVSVGSGRVEMPPLRIRISTDIAVALGLIFHELVTNAVKYGALSNDTGRLILSSDYSGDGHLLLLWREEGGPPVATPEKKGFGQTIIARGLGTQPGAGTQVEFRPEGLVCRISIPAAALVQTK